MKKTAALLGCLAFCFLAVPVWLIGTAVLRLFRRQLSEADDALGRLLSKLEFSLVILLCAAVGLVLLSVMLPLLGVLAAIG